jgi:hypothetical protein
LTFVDTKVVAICLTKSQANPVDVDLVSAVISSPPKPFSNRAAPERSFVSLYSGIDFEIRNVGPRGLFRVRVAVKFIALGHDVRLGLSILCERHHQLRNSHWQFVAVIDLPGVPRFP